MSTSFADRIPFARIITILAIIFGVSGGLCGLTWVAAMNVRGSDDWAIVPEFIEAAAMGLSLLGLIVMSLIWITASILGMSSHSSDQPQKLFDDSDDLEK
ncbi:MAG TPA: hypothetical protein VN151_10650 [Terracidiphilus sp.]|nr:hypothetical protein [Terracidiphilus sp.]